MNILACVIRTGQDIRPELRAPCQLGEQNKSCLKLPPHSAALRKKTALQSKTHGYIDSISSEGQYPAEQV